MFCNSLVAIDFHGRDVTNTLGISPAKGWVHLDLKLVFACTVHGNLTRRWEQDQQLLHLAAEQ